MIRVVLISMVKNESAIIARCLESCADICDAFCFLDTGSTDGTIGIIEAFLQDHDGAHFSEPFVDFGHSRTRSFQLCKEWLQQQHPDWDLHQVYGLLLDADMVLKPSPSLKTFDFQKGCYQVIQRVNFLEYPNTRFMRMSDTWECIGVTHEYWGGDSFHTETLPKTLVYIQDKNDGGCKSDKYMRDIRLLEEGIKNDKKNEIRYTFYLAQSYENIDKQRSIFNYKKRIQMGGWFEEVFIAWMRIGDLTDNPVEKVNCYLEAFEVDGKRSESLYRLARYYRLQGKNHLGFQVGKMAKSISYPEDRSLFLEKDVYDFKINEEISICAYYNPYPNDAVIGFQCCEDNLLRRCVPEQSFNLAFENEVFYIKRLGFKKKICWQIQSDFIPSSCSFLLGESSFMGCQRMVNYSISEKGEYIYDGTVQTQNYIIQGKEDMRISTIRKINVLVPKQRQAHVQDLEDIRIVLWQDELFGIATTNEYGDNEYPSQVLCHFTKDGDIDSIVQLDYCPDRVQKNWCPFVYKGQLACVYDYEPFVLLHIDRDGTCHEILRKYQPYHLRHFRGSSSPIYCNDRIYQVVHIVYYHKKRKYVHRIVEYDDSFSVLKVSKPFYFEQQGIEFCLGFAYDDKQSVFYIHYSTDDNTSNLAEVPLSSIQWSETLL